MTIDEMEKIIEVMRATSLDEYIPESEHGMDRIRGELSVGGIKIIVETLLYERSTMVFIKGESEEIMLCHLDEGVRSGREVHKVRSAVKASLNLIENSMKHETPDEHKNEARRMLMRPDGMGLHAGLDDEGKARRIKWIIHFYIMGETMEQRERTIGNEWMPVESIPTDFSLMFRIAPYV